MSTAKSHPTTRSITSIPYDVKHFQEVLINVKKSQYLEEYIKKLEKENNEMKKENNRIIKQFICFGQDLVNLGELQIGREPYFCNHCRNVYEGDYVKDGELIEDIICLDCDQKKNNKM